MFLKRLLLVLIFVIPRFIYCDINISKIHFKHPITNIKEKINIYSPKKGVDWQELKYHKIVWGEPNKKIKFPNLQKKEFIAIYLVDKKGKNVIKEIVVGKIKSPYKWFIDEHIYKFPGYFRIKVVNGNKVGLSPVFHISKRIKIKEINYKLETMGYNLSKHNKFITIPPYYLSKEGYPDIGKIYNGEIRVGFANRYETTGLLGVDSEYHGIVSRGYVRVPNSIKSLNIKSILSATIHLERRKSICYKTAINPNDMIEAQKYNKKANCKCIKSVYLRLKKGNPFYNGNPFKSSSKFIQYVDKKDIINIGVAPEIKRWLKGKTIRPTFEFIGIDESLSENNNKCISIYKNIKLKLKYLESNDLVAKPFPK